MWNDRKQVIFQSLNISIRHKSDFWKWKISLFVVKFSVWILIIFFGQISQCSSIDKNSWVMMIRIAFKKLLGSKLQALTPVLYRYFGKKNQVLRARTFMSMHINDLTPILWRKKRWKITKVSDSKFSGCLQIVIYCNDHGHYKSALEFPEAALSSGSSQKNISNFNGS